MASRAERAAADLFMADLFGPQWPAAAPARYRYGYGYAQQAELLLDTEELTELTFDLLVVRDEAELAEFIGGLARRVKRAARDLAKTIGRAANDVANAKLVKAIAKGAGPMLGTLAKLASRSPIGALARGTWGGISAALRGQNILMGALDGLSGSPLFGAMIKMGGAILRGDNLIAAAKLALKAGIADAREAIRFAAMVAPFVPGVGTGVAAALGAADALAAGKPITDALIAGVRSAIPGGMIAQAAFDTGAQLLAGKRIDQALLTAARNRLPPGPAQAAFDTGVAIGQGKNLQQSVLAGAGGLLPPSPYSADAMAFAQRAMAGQNLGQAALSTAGNAVMTRVQQQGGNLLGTVQGRAGAAVAAAPAASAVRRQAPGIEQAIQAAAQVSRRQADRFMSDLTRGPAAPPRLAVA